MNKAGADWLSGFELEWIRETGGEWEKVAGGEEILAELRVEVREGAAEAGGASLSSVDVRVKPGSASGSSLRIAGVRLVMAVDERLGCVWKPHLAPMDGMAVGDKAFRSPAIVFEDAERMTALVPDVGVLAKGTELPHVMDYELKGHRVWYGACEYEETGHVYHRLTPRARELGLGAKRESELESELESGLESESESELGLEGQLRLRFYLASWRKEQVARPRDFRRVERLLWELFAGANMERETQQAPALAIDLEANSVGTASGGESPRDWEIYVGHAYGWAFDRWGDVCWQEFELDGVKVGGVAFLVTAAQKPGMGRENVWREPKSLWNQAWFCGLRSAYGFARWGRDRGMDDWSARAELALNFALSAPRTNGLFPGYYQAGEDGRWESGRWFMSGPRRPSGHEDYVHLLDASWTCYWLLKWHRDIRADERILPFVRDYAETLLRLQRVDGSFPAWVRPDTLEASPFLAESPETSMHAMLLCLLHEVIPDGRYLEAAERAGRFVAYRILPFGKWEDFETYWSCSGEWDGKRYGRLDERSGLYNQCNFGMYWTAEAFKELYMATGEREWLDLGEQTLAEASLYQQIWEPPFFPVPTLGGFGVMNSDDEWNDARQSLFALTYLDYAGLTGDRRYRLRAYWAMKASFYMMYCPENPEAKAIYEKVHPGFGEREYGFHMENFNHHDGTSVQGLGEFTIFDWGCGAAASSLAEFLAKWDEGARD
ncbi:hypothetical protein H7B90_24470 [Cohnella xylanilytica]|uniref:Uncharacterized protein n=1 Tax=Cohnella xylanilytica TaxID=557555 RepID=A0A841U1Y7_9BACL|nr:hypothetical protein [Cohnella xylanilytica]MBB6694555.1 hypothetical protein [Cohnella xylanilytica]